MHALLKGFREDWEGLLMFSHLLKNGYDAVKTRTQKSHLLMYRLITLDCLI